MENLITTTRRTTSVALGDPFPGLKIWYPGGNAGDVDEAPSVVRLQSAAAAAVQHQSTALCWSCVLRVCRASVVLRLHVVLTVHPSDDRSGLQQICAARRSN